MRRGTKWRFVLALGAAALGSAASNARAYTVDGPFVEGCHEEITSRALARVPWGSDVPSWPRDEMHRRLAAGVPFSVPPDVGPRTLALLIGVRSPDVAHLALTDLEELPSLHAAPGLQHQHSLREANQDGPAGDAEATAAARAFVRGEIAAALGSNDEVDAGEERVELSLAFQGTVAASLPRFPYRVGRALHALQDSFSHTFRDEAGMRIVTVHNWVDWVEGRDFDPARDGLAHAAGRDDCTVDPAAIRRAGLAERASVELLQAIADPSGGRAGRIARVDAILDRWLSLVPGCDATNDYCDTPDARGYSGGCAIASSRPIPTPRWIAFALVLLATLALRGGRREARRPTGAINPLRRRSSVIGSRATAIVAAGTLLLSASLLATSAQADEPRPSHSEREPIVEPGAPVRDAAPPSPGFEGSEPPAPRPASLALARDEEHAPGSTSRSWGASLALGGAVESPALSVALGGRWFPNDDWRVGLDVELNPWFDIAAERAAWGIFNAYGSVQWDWLRAGAVRVGTRILAGVSVLLFDLAGASAGDVGPVLGGTLIGVGFDVADGWELRVDPEAVVSMPHVVGLPVVHRQYRLTVALVWGP